MKTFDALGKQIKIGDEVAILKPKSGVIVGRVEEIQSKEIITVRSSVELSPNGPRGVRLSQQALVHMVLVLK